MISKLLARLLSKQGTADRSRTQAEDILIYNAIWQNISREDSNIASRIGWAIGLSSGLFAAIAFLTPRINDNCGGAFWPPMICAIIFGMSVLGLFFSYRTKLGVEAAHIQIADLRTHYNHRRKVFEDLGLPRPFGDSNGGQGRKSSAVYPIALLFFWSVIMVLSTTATVWTLARAATGQSVGVCEAQSDKAAGKNSTAPGDGASSPATDSTPVATGTASGR